MYVLKKINLTIKTTVHLFSTNVIPKYLVFSYSIFFKSLALYHGKLSFLVVKKRRDDIRNIFKNLHYIKIIFVNASQYSGKKFVALFFLIYTAQWTSRMIILCQRGVHFVFMRN